MRAIIFGMQKLFGKVLGHFLPGHENAYRPHLLRKPWLLFFLSVVLTAECVYVAGIMAGQSAQHYISAVLPGEVIALTNAQRVQAGDNAVVENKILNAAAQAKADDMAAKGYFAHVGPGGKEPWVWIQDAGYSYQYAGENLAVRFDESADVVNAWMASPTHRANIVKPVYTEIGIGVASGMFEGSPATFVVQYFGTPQKVAAFDAPKTDSSAVSQGGNASESVLGAPRVSEVAGAETQTVTTHITPTTSPVIDEPAIVPVAQTQTDQPMRESAQLFLRANEASGASISLIIGGVASLLVLLLALAFFIHIEIQPGDMLASGAVVAIIAFSLLALNGSFGSSGSQSASAANTGAFSKTVFVGLDAASVEWGDSSVAPVPGQ